MMNWFKRRQPPFLSNIAQHAGEYQGRSDNLYCWQIENPEQHPFDKILEKVGSEITNCGGILRSSNLLIDLFVRGTSLPSGAVYVMIAGSTLRQRKIAVKHLRKSSLPKDFPGLKIGQWENMIMSPNTVLTSRTVHLGDENIIYSCSSYVVQRSQSTAAGDDSLLFITSRVQMPQVGTLSCFVRVGQEKYLLAPAHIFNPPSEQSSNNDGPRTIFQSSQADGGRSSASPSPLDQIQDQKDGSSDAESPVTVDQSPVICHEYDYALIPSPNGSDIQQGLFEISEESVAQVSAGHHSVSTTLPSCGPMQGSLQGRPTLMRLPYADRLSRLYPVRLPQAPKKGDCGSVVFDSVTGNAYGIVVAASEEAKLAYIMPLQDILHSIIEKKSDQTPASSSFTSTTSEVQGQSLNEKADYMTEPELSIYTGEEKCQPGRSRLWKYTCGLIGSPYASINTDEELAKPMGSLSLAHPWLHDANNDEVARAQRKRKHHVPVPRVAKRARLAPGCHRDKISQDKSQLSLGDEIIGPVPESGGEGAGSSNFTRPCPYSTKLPHRARIKCSLSGDFSNLRQHIRRPHVVDKWFCGFCDDTRDTTQRENFATRMRHIYTHLRPPGPSLNHNTSGKREQNPYWDLSMDTDDVKRRRPERDISSGNLQEGHSCHKPSINGAAVSDPSTDWKSGPDISTRHTREPWVDKIARGADSLSTELPLYQRWPLSVVGDEARETGEAQADDSECGKSIETTSVRGDYSIAVGLGSNCSDVEQNFNRFYLEEEPTNGEALVVCTQNGLLSPPEYATRNRAQPCVAMAENRSNPAQIFIPPTDIASDKESDTA